MPNSLQKLNARNACLKSSLIWKNFLLLLLLLLCITTTTTDDTFFRQVTLIMTGWLGCLVAGNGFDEMREDGMEWNGMWVHVKEHKSNMGSHRHSKKCQREKE
jgi:hypothetical protein